MAAFEEAQAARFTDLTVLTTTAASSVSPSAAVAPTEAPQGFTIPSIRDVPDLRWGLNARPAAPPPYQHQTWTQQPPPPRR
ncbi:hypothetical protein ABT336_14840 [Micromonospora sp. NPDC000207]|uniref:hypothetical protein n=1 Tax=Micromonospora sp. NPDC000207 TaxID=3154246 RepID=UPI0033260BC1